MDDIPMLLEEILEESKTFSSEMFDEVRDKLEDILILIRD